MLVKGYIASEKRGWPAIAVGYAGGYNGDTMRHHVPIIAEGLDSDDGAGDGIRGHIAARCPYRILDKNLRGFPGATAQACPREGVDGTKLPVKRYTGR